MRCLMVGIAVAVLLLASLCACAYTWHVPDDVPTIQAGIDSAAVGDTVLVAPGTYTGPQNRNLYFGGTNVVLRGVAGPDSTIIDCEDAGRGFCFVCGEDFTSVVEGFTVTNGFDAHSGGGMYCEQSGPTVVNCRFSGNEARFSGGGLFCRLTAWGPAGNPRLIDVEFSGNSAEDGGGMGCFCSAATLTDVTFTCNSARYGGGLSCWDWSDIGPPSSATLTNVTFADNSASEDGGGLFCEGWSGVHPQPALTGVTFSGNSANRGGGLYCAGAQATLTDVTFEANSAGSVGGAIACHGNVLIGGGIVTVSGATFWDNQAGVAGGGIYYGVIGQADLENATLFGNEADNGAAIYGGGAYYASIARSIVAFSIRGQAVECGGATIITECCVYGNAGGDSLCGSYHDNLFEDPLFCDAGNEDFTLHTNSPCLPENNPWGVLIGAHGLGCGLAIDATVDFDPNTVNCRSYEGSATSYIELPDGYDPADIDVATVLLNGALPAFSSPTVVGDHDLDGIPDRMVKFDRGDVIDLLPLGEKVEVVLSGELTDGTAFAGADSIRVICKRRPIDVAAIPDPNLRVSSTPGISSTTVSYESGPAGPVSLRVYDVSGRVV